MFEQQLFGVYAVYEENFDYFCVGPFEDEDKAKKWLTKFDSAPDSIDLVMVGIFIDPIFSKDTNVRTRFPEEL